MHSAKGGDRKPLRIIHRDINPSNILITRSGHVKLADFGIARAYRRRSDTELGEVKGTLLYMAPEQLRAEDPDQRTDVFALGCVLYQMFVGESPLVDQTARDDAVAGRELDLGRLPQDIRPVAERALRVHRNARFKTAAELAQACRKLLPPKTETEAREETARWLASLEALEPSEVSKVVERSDSFVTNVRLISTEGDTQRFVLEAPTRILDPEKTELSMSSDISDQDRSDAQTQTHTAEFARPTVLRPTVVSPAKRPRPRLRGCRALLVLAAFALGTAAIAYQLLNAWAPR